MLLHLCPVATALRQDHLVQHTHTPTHAHTCSRPPNTQKAGRGRKLEATSSIRAKKKRNNKKLKNVQSRCFPLYFITAIMIQHLFLLVCDQRGLRRRRGGATERPTSRDERQIALRLLARCRANSVLSFQIIIKGANNKKKKGKSQLRWVSRK